MNITNVSPQTLNEDLIFFRTVFQDEGVCNKRSLKIRICQHVRPPRLKKTPQNFLLELENSGSACRTKNHLYNWKPMNHLSEPTHCRTHKANLGSDSRPYVSFGTIQY